MNDRIKELISQAQKDVWGNNPYNGSPEFEGYELDAEKFAELIVKECADYCKGHTLPKGMAEENNLNYNDGVMDCAIGLELLFGVEE